MSERSIWVMCAVLGVATLAMSFVTLDAMTIEGGDYAPGYGSAVYAFEFMTEPADMDRVFGTGPERAGNLEQMRIGTWLDFPFIALFTGFLGSFFVAMKRRARTAALTAVTVAGLGLSVLAGASDVVEDIILLGLIDAPDTLPFLDWLFAPVHAKFAALGVIGILAGWAMLSEPPGLWKLAGVLAGLGGIATLATLIDPSALGQYSSTAIGLSWLVILAFAAAKAIRPSV